MTNLLRAASRSLAAPPASRHDDYHLFQGNQYWNNVLSGWEPNSEGISGDFATLVSRGFKGNAPVFACELTRMALISQARPAFRRLRNGRRGDLFGTQELSVLERPWPGGNFASLAAKMELDAAFGGTAFVGRRRERPDRLLRMRPDWVTMILGSYDEPDDEAQFALDADFLGIMYHPGGRGAGREPKILLADEVAVWAPIPDPLAAYRGVPWPTAALREIDSDLGATIHKGKFFENGATPQLFLQLDPGIKREQFQEMVQVLNASHTGAHNAYRTLALQGATPHVVGKDLHQLDFKATQGAGETRIAAASGVHPVVAALSEGLSGSSLNAGNFRAACRLVADRTLYPLWSSMFAALATIVPGPDDAELWYDKTEISFLQEDRKDAAEIELIKAQTIVAYVRDGFTPESATAAVEAEDTTLLVHSGLVSVQLQAPGAGGAAPKAGGAAPAPQLPARTYNPSQPRDDDGQWSDGMPDIISSHSLKLGGVPGAIESMRGDRARLTLGAASVTADRDYFLNGLSSALNVAKGHRNVLDEKYRPLMVLKFGDYVDDVGAAATVEFPGQGVTVKLSPGDVRRLRDAADRAVVARRVDLVSGPVDVFLDGKSFGIRTAPDDGDSVALLFDARSWSRLSAAENTVMEGFDEAGDYGPVGAEVNELVVRTPNGPIRISRDVPHQGISDARFNVTIAAVDRGGWSLTHTSHHSDPWFDAVDGVENVADLEGFFSRASSPAVIVERAS